MSKARKVTITRPNLTTVWPFDQFQATAAANWNFLENVGIATYIDGDEDTDLTVEVYHHIDDDALFDEYDALREFVIPLWRNQDNIAEVDAYNADNNITITEEIIIEPVLTGFTLIGLDRYDIRAARTA